MSLGARRGRKTRRVRIIRIFSAACSFFFIWISAGVLSDSLFLSLRVPGHRLRSQCGLISAAIYFPQYHEDVNNNIFWGKGFTEWDHLHNVNFDAVAKHEIRKPLHEYTLSLRILRLHAKQAAASGIGAFIFYSYWFEHGRRALDKPLLQLLPRKRLGNSFALSWANEPWTRRWNGQDGNDVLVTQKYGTSYEWASHFDWLKQFFSHPDYLHIDNRPVLFIYNMRHVVETVETIVEEGDCDTHSERLYGPGGLMAAELYKKWYPDVIMELSALHKHWNKVGRAEGRQWPMLPCAESNATRTLRARTLSKSSSRGSTLSRMVSFLQAYAKERGFKGIYIVGTLNTFVIAKDFDTFAGDMFDAAAQFLPMNLMNEIAEKASSCGCSSSSPFSITPEEECPPSCACVHNVTRELAKSQACRPASTVERRTKFFHGAFNFWSNYPRHLKDGGVAANAICSKPDYTSFKHLLDSQLRSSLQDMCTPISSDNPAEISSILLLNAWNEWGEQAVMEPTVQDGNAALLAHREAIEEIESDIDRYTESPHQ